VKKKKHFEDLDIHRRTWWC